MNLQLHGISLGLVHLNSHHVVHGDLKAVSGSTSQAIYALLTASHVLFQANVLVDDGANAVLCDFGLSRVKDDTMGRTSQRMGNTLFLVPLIIPFGYGMRRLEIMP